MPENTLVHFVAATFEVALVTTSFEQVRNFSRKRVERWRKETIGKPEALELIGRDGARIAELIQNLLRISLRMHTRQDCVHRIGAASSIAAGFFCLGLLYFSWVEYVGNWCAVLLIPTFIIFLGDIWAYWRFHRRAKGYVEQIEYLTAAYTKPPTKTELKAAIEAFDKAVLPQQSTQTHGHS